LYLLHDMRILAAMLDKTCPTDDAIMPGWLPR
jgi:hypothetical protein